MNPVLPRFSVIAAMTKSSRGIGAKNGLPWHYKEDMDFFSNITIGFGNNAVIMGKNTWDSLPKKFRPLPNRQNYVVSKNLFGKIPNCFEQLDEALEMCKLKNQTPFVIGGQQLYESAVRHNNCETVYLTEIDDTKRNEGHYECDTFFPPLPRRFHLTYSLKGYTPELTFNRYENWSDATSEEQRYLQLLKDIIDNGEDHSDRTGTGIKSVFGRQLRFSIDDGVIPLMTTKKTFFKGIVEELLFFLRGDHDNRKLQAKGVHIWDGNTSREYLDQYNKKHIQEHDLGLAYGVQWRAAGAKLGNIETDYRGKGIDQISNVLDLIRSDPNSRRIIINAWNVPQLDDMALVPCHCMYQFYVSNDNKLSCMMTQRS